VEPAAANATLALLNTRLKDLKVLRPISTDLRLVAKGATKLAADAKTCVNASAVLGFAALGAATSCLARVGTEAKTAHMLAELKTLLRAVARAIGTGSVQATAGAVEQANTWLSSSFRGLSRPPAELPPAVSISAPMGGAPYAAEAKKCVDAAVGPGVLATAETAFACIVNAALQPAKKLLLSLLDRLERRSERTTADDLLQVNLKLAQLKVAVTLPTDLKALVKAPASFLAQARKCMDAGTVLDLELLKTVAACLQKANTEALIDSTLRLPLR
jgi:hypothetical protein